MYCSLDMLSPFQIKEGRKTHKSYVALITCFTSSAIDLQPAKDMSTDSCINFVQRFICRRGTIRSIQSDSNFIGADNELKKAFSEEVFGRE